jgi:hypothetical protein
MENIVGRKFNKYFSNVMTVTSMNSDGFQQWVVDSVIDKDTVYCELKSTDMSMYSGSGYFKEFKIKDIKLIGIDI